MPYCPQCGSTVGGADQFCASCGGRQPSHAGAGPGQGFTQGSAQSGAAATASVPFAAGISSRNAALLCYIPWVGWVAAIVVLASERFRRDTQTRFHAFQGLYLFVAWLLVEWVISPALWWDSFPMHRVIPEGLHLVILIAWIFMIIKVSHDEHYHLPIIGELADRSVCEQRS
jgi:uncharacterized membrane protein